MNHMNQNPYEQHWVSLMPENLFFFFVHAVKLFVIIHYLLKPESYLLSYLKA